MRIIPYAEKNTNTMYDGCDASCMYFENKVPRNTNDIMVPTAEFDLTDTITKITIQDSTLAFPQIFEGSFAAGTKATQFGTEIIFDKIAVGNLVRTCIAVLSVTFYILVSQKQLLPAMQRKTIL